MRRAVAGIVAVLSPSVTLWSAASLAYRPFDGTDAAVVDPGEIEVELGPVEYLQQGSQRSLIAPDLTLDYGFAERWEATLQGQAVYGLSAGAKSASLIGDGAFLKTVLREGSLQGKPGPSLATEFGLLLPGVNAEPGTGGSVTAIASQRWPWLTVHLNLGAAVTRQQHGDLLVDAIIEGPFDWPVRPVGEISHGQDFGGPKATSALIGAIWQARDALAFDIGLRHGRMNGESFDEIRAGVTFSFRVH